MSVAAMTWVWMTSASKGRELLVELALADFADDDGVSWYAVKRIAEKARCSESQVHNTIRRLKEQGRLSVEEAASERRTNRYTLQVDWTVLPKRMAKKGAEIAPSEAESSPEESAEELHPQGAEDYTRRVQRVAPGRVQRVAPDLLTPPLTDPPPDPSAKIDRVLRHRLILATELLPGEFAQVQIEFPGVDLSKAWREWREWIEEEPERRIPRERLKAFRGFVNRQRVDQEAASKATGPPRRQAAGARR